MIEDLTVFIIDWEPKKIKSFPDVSSGHRDKEPIDVRLQLTNGKSVKNTSKRIFFCCVSTSRRWKGWLPFVEFMWQLGFLHESCKDTNSQSTIKGSIKKNSLIQSEKKEFNLILFNAVRNWLNHIKTTQSWNSILGVYKANR